MSDYEKLKKLIDDTEELMKTDVTNSSPEFKAWEMRVIRFISKQFGENSIEMIKFNKTSFVPSFFSSSQTNREIHIEYVDRCHKGLGITKAILETYLEDIEDEEEKTEQLQIQTQMDLSKVFIVHGHDEALKQTVANIIREQDIEAIILSEKANQGRTIIEKFEQNSDVGCAICLFTADDVGRAKTESDNKTRARQNVVFETGYFIGKLGRDHVVILAESDIEIPSDLAGVVYTNMQDWKIDLLKELNAMGYSVDLNKLLK